MHMSFQHFLVELKWCFVLTGDRHSRVGYTRLLTAMLLASCKILVIIANFGVPYNLWYSSLTPQIYTVFIYTEYSTVSTSIDRTKNASKIGNWLYTTSSTDRTHFRRIYMHIIIDFTQFNNIFAFAYVPIHLELYSIRSYTTTNISKPSVFLEMMILISVHLLSRVSLHTLHWTFYAKYQCLIIMMMAFLQNTSNDAM